MRQAESDGGLRRHGGRVDLAAARFPQAPKPWLDLSTGINPVPWRSATDLVVDAGPLPTTGVLRTLESAAADYLGVEPARVAALPGSEIGLRLLPSIGLVPSSIGPGPRYATHVEVAAARHAGHHIDRAGEDAVLLANPNNPDGTVISHARLRSIAAAQEERGGWLIVDEAFADVDPATSILRLVEPTSRIIVFRSFGKFFGLAGLRLGFVVGPSDICRRYRALLGDWPVSAHAIAIGTAAYRDASWISRTQVDLVRRADDLDRLLARHGLVATGRCPLFRLVDHPDAADIFERLARAGILTRAFDDAPTWLRFGLPADAAASDRLDRALARG